MLLEDHRTKPPTMSAADQRRAIIASAVPRDIPLDLALEAIRHHAAREQVYVRMGAGHPSEDGYPTVRESVVALLGEVCEIEKHECDFGGDGDSLCGTCGSDPRS
jgi:hypothetical protein